jgi:hypothetical protein
MRDSGKWHTTLASGDIYTDPAIAPRALVKARGNTPLSSSLQRVFYFRPIKPMDTPPPQASDVCACSAPEHGTCGE